MILHDFQHTLDNHEKQGTERQFARACWAAHRLVCDGKIDREVRVYGESHDVALIVTAEDGWEWDFCWPLYDDARWIDPLGHCPVHIQHLAQALGLLPSDFASAVKNAAPKLILDGEWDAPEDGGPRTPAERVRACEDAIKAVDARVDAWERSINSVDIEKLKARHESKYIAAVQAAMGIFPEVRREG